ncbi:MAG: AMP-binding protein [Magnetococcales bacterium]|nr:AMP-binding protein [Magnetococcales bacterium]
MFDLLSRLARYLTRRLLPLQVIEHGAWTIKRPGALLLCCNHHRGLPDALVMACLLPAGGSLLFPPGEKLRFGWLFRLLGVRPVAATADWEKTLRTLLQQGGRVATWWEYRPWHCSGTPPPRPKPLENLPWLAFQEEAALQPIHLRYGIHGSRFRPWRPLHRNGTLYANLFPPTPDPLGFTALAATPSRELLISRLETTLEQLRFTAGFHPRSLWENLLHSPLTSRQPLIADSTGLQLTGKQLIHRSIVLAILLRRHTPPGNAIGVLLPTSGAAVLVFFALQSLGRLPALLNFTLGSATLAACARQARLSVLVTSRRFVAQAKLEETLATLGREFPVLYLEDLKKSLSNRELLLSLYWSKRPKAWYRRSVPQSDPHQPAVLLFTSGSEGNPKAVQLSHANLLANCVQMGSRVSFGPGESLFNALPLFHSFGLTVCTLAPLFSGMRLFLHTSPLDFHNLPGLVFSSQATILAGTDTFLARWGRYARPADFQSLRLVFAGAEPLREETERLWHHQFGLRILQGYGATETSPVLAVNSPDRNLPGSVGPLLPGLAARLEPVPGLNHGGRLLVSGPNIMRGYLRDDGDHGLEIDDSGLAWYDTGDVAVFEEGGFLRLLGRVKRFAKVAGEMVSLGAIEELAHRVWPEGRHAALAHPDASRGEVVILVTECRDALLTQLLAAGREEGWGPVQLPRRLLFRAEIPSNGTGKIDYPALGKWLATDHP